MSKCYHLQILYTFSSISLNDKTTEYLVLKGPGRVQLHTNIRRGRKVYFLRKRLSSSLAFRSESLDCDT